MWSPALSVVVALPTRLVVRLVFLHVSNSEHTTSVLYLFFLAWFSRAIARPAPRAVPHRESAVRCVCVWSNLLSIWFLPLRLPFVPSQGQKRLTAWKSTLLILYFVKTFCSRQFCTFLPRLVFLYIWPKVRVYCEAKKLEKKQKIQKKPRDKGRTSIIRDLLWDNRDSTKMKLFSYVTLGLLASTDAAQSKYHVPLPERIYVMGFLYGFFDSNRIHVSSALSNTIWKPKLFTINFYSFLVLCIVWKKC